VVVVTENTQPVRVVIFTLDDSVFSPRSIRGFVEQYHSQIVYAVVAESPALRNAKRLWRDLIQAFYPSPRLLLECYRFMRLLRESSGESTSDLLKRYEIPVMSLDRFDEPAVEALRKLKPDLFLFCPFNLIAGPRTLAIPKIGTFNLHMAKLPEYQGGVSTFFWNLYNSDLTGGVTLHEVTTVIDEGRIVARRSFPLECNDIFTSMIKTFEHASEVLLNNYESLISGSWQETGVDFGSAVYYQVPRRKHVKAFLGRGLHFAPVT